MPPRFSRSNAKLSLQNSILSILDFREPVTLSEELISMTITASMSVRFSMKRIRRKYIEHSSPKIWHAPLKSEKRWQNNCEKYVVFLQGQITFYILQNNISEKLPGLPGLSEQNAIHGPSVHRNRFSGSPAVPVPRGRHLFCRKAHLH